MAAIYYLVYIERYGLADYERIWVAGSLAVTVSVLGYALTSALTVRAYRSATGLEVSEGEEVDLGGPPP